MAGAVKRESINHRHADFQSRIGSLKALYFNVLPGRPLPNLQDNAELVHAKFTHALRLYAKIQFVCGRVGRFGVPLKPGQNRIHFRD